jgi:peptide/nickel transport system permease protein
LKVLLLRRAATFIPTVFIATVLVFALRSLIPGGPAEALLGSAATPEAIAATNERLGLNHPIVVQYLHWLGGVLHGDMGQSYTSGVPVSEIIGERLAPTIELVFGALLIAIVVGGGAGMIAGIKRDRPSGGLILGLTGLGLSIPDFWLATIAAGLFGLTLRLVPAEGFVPISDGLGPNLHSAILPILVLALPVGTILARQVYSAVVAALRSPYVRTAWAMGIPARTVYFNCALRNAVAPVVTFIPLAIATLIGSAVVVESVFQIAGLGNEIVLAVDNRDFATVQAIVLLMAVLVLILNLIADVVVAMVDPRAHRGGRRASRVVRTSAASGEEDSLREAASA